MEIEVREIMDNNEMLSHIFFSSLNREQVKLIRDKYVAGADWQKESVKIPIEMKIGGFDVNPKAFFDEWKSQMERMILDEAKKLVAEQMGSRKITDMVNKLYDYQQILESWEKEINWEVKNPLI